MIEINPEKLVKNTSSAGELIFRGGLALQAELGAQNVQRFQNFLTTPPVSYTHLTLPTKA